MTAIISLISISCLVVLAFLYNKINLSVISRLLSIEDRLKLTQDGELRRMLAKANETIANLKKENKLLGLQLEFKDMEESIERTE